MLKWIAMSGEAGEATLEAMEVGRASLVRIFAPQIHYSYFFLLCGFSCNFLNWLFQTDYHNAYKSSYWKSWKR